MALNKYTVGINQIYLKISTKVITNKSIELLTECIHPLAIFCINKMEQSILNIGVLMFCLLFLC